MHRRHFLGAVGVSLLSGCVTSGDNFEGSSTTASPTPTPKPSPTATPEPKAPAIDTVALLSGWDNFGDTLDQQVDAVGQGAPAIISYRFQAGVHGGTNDTTNQVKIYDSAGDRVAIDQSSDEQLVDDSGYDTWEHAMRFETSQWSKGEYTAEVLIRDNVINKTSETVSHTFQVNSPLTESEAELADVEATDTVAVGDEYAFKLSLENTSTRDGSVVSPISAKYESSNTWTTFSDTKAAVTMGAKETNTTTEFSTTFDYEGTALFRLDALNEMWDVHVTN